MMKKIEPEYGPTRKHRKYWVLNRWKNRDGAISETNMHYNQALKKALMKYGLFDMYSRLYKKIPYPSEYIYTPNPAPTFDRTELLVALYTEFRKHLRDLRKMTNKDRENHIAWMKIKYAETKE